MLTSGASENGSAGSVLIAAGTGLNTGADITVTGGDSLNSVGGSVGIYSGDGENASGDVILASLKSSATGAVNIQSGEATDFRSGDVTVSSGNANGPSGSLILRTGSSQSGATGDVILLSGSPGAYLTPADDEETAHRAASIIATTHSNGIESGNVTVKTSDSLVRSGEINLGTGSATTENSGSIKVNSGQSEEGTAGTILIESGNAISEVEALHS
jgi:hypothetical protein